MQKIKYLFVCLLTTMAFSQTVKAQSKFEKWSELKSFHTVMSQTFHPSEEKLGAEFYFTHPYSAWEKGLVENVNGLIRQYVPKKDDFSQISPEHIRRIEDRLNNRPRNSLGWKTPMQVFLSNFVKPNQNVALVT